ncbi:MAG TPA: hypothetical protein PLE92_04480 [Lentisphaeria bacterium]|mgnify:FL=1|nr:hypothetical protein [Lentisphaeria bacterium]HQL87673.1 hypothetical protein [Lentisphaeria bacterium]
MKMLCPQCGSALPPEAVNIATDLAQCPECGRLHQASACIVEDEVSQNVLRRPPPGTWLRQEADAIVIGVTMRSRAAWFHIPFTVAWSGGSLYGIYGTQIINGNFNLILSLFGIPFLIGTIFLIKTAIYMLFGRQEWHLDEDGGTVFNGVGRFSKHWRFAWKDLTRIYIHTSRSDEDEDEINFKLILEGTSPKVEVILPKHEDRRQFIICALRYYHQQWQRRK